MRISGNKGGGLKRYERYIMWAHPLAQMILRAAVGAGAAGSVLKYLGLLRGAE